MSVSSAVTSGLHGAWLLARGRSDGLRYVEADMAGAARSFWALPVCLPAIVCLRLMSWLQDGVPPHAGHEFGLYLLAAVLGWLGFALLSFYMAPAFGAAERWPRYIAAWNWCNVVENLLIVVGSVPGLLGAPPLVDEVCQVFALGWALWIEWFATRAALGVGGLVAAWLVSIDLVLGLMLAGLSATLLHG
jgi:hypothetical protein